MMERQTRKVPRSVSSGSQIHSQDLVDRINDLPDSILSHILSFLPTKNSVATSILSQRWKFLWKDVSNFDFCNAVNIHEDVDDANLAKFIEFVNHVLLSRKGGSINNFSLVYESQSVSSYVNCWINHAIANNVQTLFLNMSHAIAFKPRPRIFSCESLHSLELKCNFVIHSANVPVSLPRLETLKLTSIRFQDEEAFQKLILGCPVLKCLCVSTFVEYNKKREDWDEDDWEVEDYTDESIVEEDRHVFKFMVYSTSLKRLEFVVSGNLPDTRYCSLELETPSLEVLKLKDCVSRIFLERSLSSLLEVEFEIKESVIGVDDIVEYLCDYVVEAVRAFSYAKCLTLTPHVIRALGLAHIKLNTKFKRLTELWIMYEHGGWQTLPDSMDFIQYSDSLAKIVFTKRVYSEDSDNNCWEYPTKVPKCLTNSLKEVLFYAFEGLPDEMDLVEYLLKHGSVLQNISIHCSEESCYDYKEMFDMVKRISNFSQKSPACKLRFL